MATKYSRIPEKEEDLSDASSPPPRPRRSTWKRCIPSLPLVLKSLSIGAVFVTGLFIGQENPSDRMCAYRTAMICMFFFHAFISTLFVVCTKDINHLKLPSSNL